MGTLAPRSVGAGTPGRPMKDERRHLDSNNDTNTSDSFLFHFYNQVLPGGGQ